MRLLTSNDHDSVKLNRAIEIAPLGHHTRLGFKAQEGLGPNCSGMESEIVTFTSVGELLQFLEQNGGT